jgi:hypothetical protein
VRDADVFESDVELRGAFEEVGADAGGDGFALGYEFCGVELGDDGFEDFVADGGEDALVVVEAEVLGGKVWLVWFLVCWICCGKGMGLVEAARGHCVKILPVSSCVEIEERTYLIDLRQSLDFRSMQHPQCQADHLQILAPRRRRDIPWLGADIVDNAFLQPGNEEVCAFVHDCVLDSGETVEDHGAAAAFNVVDGGLGEGEADGEGDCVFGNGAEGCGSHGGW